MHGIFWSETNESSNGLDIIIIIIDILSRIAVVVVVVVVFGRLSRLELE